jgi:hypothetical protein
MVTQSLIVLRRAQCSFALALKVGFREKKKKDGAALETFLTPSINYFFTLEVPAILAPPSSIVLKPYLTGIA